MKGWFTWLSLIYCAELLLPDGSRANRKSTGTTNKTEAEKIVMSWIVNGNIPVRTNSKEQNVVTVDKLSLFNGLRIFPTES